MKKISPSTRLKEIITDYQLDQIFPGDCLSQLDLVLYQAGEYICRQGSEQDVIPYFLKGRLKIVHSLENGSDTILEIQEKPGLLGEIELLLDRVCITSVIADQDSLVVQLPAQLGRAVCNDIPTAASSKFFVLILLFQALELHILHALGWAHERCRTDESGQLVRRVQQLFHLVLGLNIHTDGPAVAAYRMNGRLIRAALAQQHGRLDAVLFSVVQGGSCHLAGGVNSQDLQSAHLLRL